MGSLSRAEPFSATDAWKTSSLLECWRLVWDALTRIAQESAVRREADIGSELCFYAEMKRVGAKRKQPTT